MTADITPRLTMLCVELIANSSAERDYAFLVYADDDLVAVLARPQPPATAELQRSWVLEASFGPCSGPGPTVWHDLGEFHQWVLERCRAAQASSKPKLRRSITRRSGSSMRQGRVEKHYAGWDVRPAGNVRPVVH
jgi:hypothetical protein